LFCSTTQRDPNFVKIVEVAPRDGLQNEKVMIPAEVKVELINRLEDAGVSFIEATSFVSPKWVPQVSFFLNAKRNWIAQIPVLQMADAPAVLAGVRVDPHVTMSVLTPNVKGLEAALKASEKMQQGKKHLEVGAFMALSNFLYIQVVN
jgi:hydroxymethylglutaryl-CoA lyase